MAELEEFTETVGSLSRATGYGIDTIRRLAKLGLIEHRRLSTGLRIFPRSAIDAIRRIVPEQRALIGRYPRKATGSDSDPSNDEGLAGKRGLQIVQQHAPGTTQGPDDGTRRSPPSQIL